MSYSADQWPGPPAVLPPLIPLFDRMPAYQLAAYEGVAVEELFAAWCDIGQRLAAALHSAPPLAQDSEATRAYEKEDASK